MRYALLIVLLLIPASLAQTQVLDDADGDATATLAGAQAPGVDPKGFDLIGLWVSESSRDFTFTLKVKDIDPENPTAQDGGMIDVDFNHADQGYRLRLLRDVGINAMAFRGLFMAYEPGRGDYQARAWIDPTIDTAEESAAFAIPRDWLLDGNGTAPTVGRELDYFRAFARSNNVFGFGGSPSLVQMRDAMPDTGYGTLPYPIQFGLQQSGHAFLASQTPVRASNGEKGTFVFYVTASNLSPDEDRFDLTVRDVPKDWEITLPGGSLRLGGNESRAFPVLASVPFAHAHGAFENFVLEMKSQTATSSVGRIELGVRYLATPQPAGHHNHLYLHSREEAGNPNSLFGMTGGTFVTAYFNTLEVDDNDVGAKTPPFGGQMSAGRQQFNWDLYLEPGLEMGLDFDLNKTGDITVTFSSEVSTYTGVFSGYLVHQRAIVRDNGPSQVIETVVATIPPSSPQSIGQATAFESVIRPTKAADLIPFSEHAALLLRLNVTLQDGPQFIGTSQTDPMLAGGQFTLPLNEYRDSVEGVFNSLAGLKFVNNGPKERSVNPGETVLFNLTLTNDGAVDDVFSLRVNGTNAAWARVLGDQEIFVPTGSSRPVVIAVAAPGDAPHLDVADLVVTAASKAEPTIQGHSRVVALVDDVLDYPDEAHLISDLEKGLKSEKKSPGAPVALLLASLTGLVAALRRRPA